MKCFQILNDNVLIVNDGTEYIDTVVNFKIDSGIKLDVDKIIYDDTQKCCVVNDEWQDYPNSEYDGYIAKVDKYIANKAVRTYVPPTPPTLEEVKEAKKADLKAERDALEVANIEVNGNTFDYDERSRERINIAITMLEAAPQETSISWAMADNSTADVTLADLKSVIVAVGMRSEELHARYRTAKEAVNACETAEEVAKITL